MPTLLSPSPLSVDDFRWSITFSLGCPFGSGQTEPRPDPRSILKERVTRRIETTLGGRCLRVWNVSGSGGTREDRSTERTGLPTTDLIGHLPPVLQSETGQSPVT